jgi:hypothetical protein
MLAAARQQTLGEMLQTKSPAQRPGFPIVESKLAAGAKSRSQPRELISP